jgi:hypothetical protein
VDLNTFIIAVFCLIEDRIKDRIIRARGPAPKLSEAEILTMEIVGEFLGIDTAKGIYRYVRRHYAEWFPALRKVLSRTVVLLLHDRAGNQPLQLAKLLHQNLRIGLDNVLSASLVGRGALTLQETKRPCQ